MNTSAWSPLAVPAWVQARSLGVYQLVFQGGIAAGSAVWGIIAEHFGNSIAGEKLDLTPSSHWSEPNVVIELRPDDGPVLITVEYHIDPKQHQEFAKAMQEVSISRRRDGAIRWGLFHDTAIPNRYLETFVVESWAEHFKNLLVLFILVTCRQLFHI